MKPTPAPPEAEGDAFAQASLFEDAFLDKESLIAKDGERSPSIDHPLLGGAKLKTLTTKRPGVGFVE